MHESFSELKTSQNVAELNESTENINDFVPSVLHPRAVRRINDNNLSQLSTTSRFSLSLKKKSRLALQLIKTENFCTPASQNIKNSDCKNEQKEWKKHNYNLPQALCVENVDSIQQNHKNDTLNIFAKDEITIDKHSIKEVIENNRCLSIHSCDTQLLDYTEYHDNPVVHASPCLTSNPHSSSLKTDEKLIIHVSDGRVKMQKLSNEQYNRARKRKSSEDLMLVLNKKVIKDYARIVVEPPNVKMYKKAGKKKISKDQKKITGFFNRIAPSEKLSANISSDDDCIFVSEEILNVSDMETLKETSPRKDFKTVDAEIKTAYFSNLEKNPISPATTASVGNVILKSAAKNSSVLTGPSQQVIKGKSPATPTSLGNVIAKSVAKKSSGSTIPPHKVIPGTQFAVDAFSYGDIRNVSTYFLTHFHSDHYRGLKNSFNKTLYCSRITAELCIMKLSVNPKCIKIIEPDETLMINDVEVTALDANHCPGAIMLVMSLPTGANILHCGDFRASYAMESYPAFWNKDITTIYLDTTYCNPRYDFPTQDESIEMAINILNAKKNDMERANKDFSKVLIVCGSYTIGKERFFMGLLDHLGCSVWAKRDKDAILQKAMGQSFSKAPPQLCQMHVLEMRLLTFEDLKSHLNSMGDAFDEVIAFKPSGWEKGKAPYQRENINIHGIPYSEHSSFNEMVRFVKFLQPKLVIPTVPIPGGIKSVQKYFPCPLSTEEDSTQRRISDYYTKSKKIQFSVRCGGQ